MTGTLVSIYKRKFSTQHTAIESCNIAITHSVDTKFESRLGSKNFNWCLYCLLSVSPDECWDSALNYATIFSSYVLVHHGHWVQFISQYITSVIGRTSYNGLINRQTITTDVLFQSKREQLMIGAVMCFVFPTNY